MNASKLIDRWIVRWMSSENVVNYSLREIDKELKVIVIPGFWNKVIYQCLKVVPKGIYYKVASRGWDLL